MKDGYVKVTKSVAAAAFSCKMDVTEDFIFCATTFDKNSFPTFSGIQSWSL